MKMGGAGDPPAPVGDPPTGTAASNVAKRPCPLAQPFALVPSGESPDGTGGSRVLPASQISREKALPCVKRNENSETNRDQKVLSNEENEANDTGNCVGVGGGLISLGARGGRRA